jgi:SAM-dependent methyltransferase
MQTERVISRRASEYGDTHAAVYDRIYGARFAPDPAVAALARAAGPGGRLLELGLGTGRLAIPLVACGVHVDGIEASGAMIERFRAHAAGLPIGVFQVDLTDFDLPRINYDVAVCAVSTLFMLTSRAAQQSCIASAARHLRPGGRFFIEAFRPDPGRYDADGRRVETRADPDGGVHVVRSLHDPDRGCIHITHELTDAAGRTSYHVTLHYATPDELDEMALEAGLSLTARWHDWSGSADEGASTDPISVYTLDTTSR